MGKPRYRLGFQFDIKGCVADCRFNDTALLQRLSNSSSEVVELKLTPGADGKSSVLTGFVLSEVLIQGYDFITYKLRPAILKSLLLSHVECVDFPDTPVVAIENKAEIEAAGLPLSCQNPLYRGTVVPKCPTIDVQELD